MNSKSFPVLMGNCDRCKKMMPVYSTSRNLGRCAKCHRSGLVKVLVPSE